MRERLVRGIRCEITLEGKSKRGRPVNFRRKTGNGSRTVPSVRGRKRGSGKEKGRDSYLGNLGGGLGDLNGGGTGKLSYSAYAEVLLKITGWRRTYGDHTGRGRS